MLLNYEHEIFVEALAVVIAQAGDARTVAKMSIVAPAEQSRFLRSLTLELPDAEDAARHIAGLCLKDRWTAAPSWLESFMAYVNLRAQSPHLRDLIARVRRGEDPTPNVFDNNWLNQVPFFDRTGLRPLARTLLTTTNLPVLRVNGPAGAGCSYTTRVLQEIAATLSHEIRVIGASIPKDTATVYKVEELVADLALPFGGEVPPRNGSAYPTDLARWLLRSAMQKPQTQVFVIDGAGTEGVNEEIRLFIAAMADRICEQTIRSHVRMVLLQHPEKVARVLDADTREEVVPPASALKVVDVQRCLTELEARRAAEGKGALPVPVDALAAAILQEAPPDGAPRLRHVHQRLYDLFAR